MIHRTPSSTFSIDSFSEYNLKRSGLETLSENPSDFILLSPSTCGGTSGPISPSHPQNSVNVFSSVAAPHGNNMNRRNVYVSGLPPHFRSNDFRALCQQYGCVEASKLCIDCNSKPTKGYGFALFYTEESASACIAGLNGCLLSGRRLQSRYAASTANPQPLRDVSPQAIHPPLPRGGDAIPSGRRRRHHNRGNRSNQHMLATLQPTLALTPAFSPHPSPPVVTPQQPSTALPVYLTGTTSDEHGGNITFQGTVPPSYSAVTSLSQIPYTLLQDPEEHQLKRGSPQATMTAYAANNMLLFMPPIAAAAQLNSRPQQPSPMLLYDPQGRLVVVQKPSFIML